MCFYTTKYQKPKIAKEDIVCWKILISYHVNQSRIMGYRYEKGVVNPRVILKKMCDIDLIDNVYLINEGYHSYTSEAEAKSGLSRGFRVTKFIIPKGTRYFHNIEMQEYVSETIILK